MDTVVYYQAKYFPENDTHRESQRETVWNVGRLRVQCGVHLERRPRGGPSTLEGARMPSKESRPVQSKGVIRHRNAFLSLAKPTLTDAGGKADNI